MRPFEFIFKTVAKRKLNKTCSPLNVDFNDFSDVSFRGRVHVTPCIYNRQIKLWEKIKRLNLKDENT